MEKATINNADLKTALRCYIRISPTARPNIKDCLIKSEIYAIIKRRHFLERSKGSEVKIFAHWLGSGDIETPTTAETAKFFGVPLPAVQNIVAKFINTLTAEICTDLKCGLLKLQPYFDTKREKRIKETQILHKAGYKRPAPLRLPKSVAQGFENAGLTVPKCPTLKQKHNRTAKLYYWLDECLKSVQRCIFYAPHIDRPTLDRLETIIKNEMNITKLIENE